MRKHLSNALRDKLGITHKTYYANRGPVACSREPSFFPPVWGIELIKDDESVGFVMSTPRAHGGDGFHHVRRTATGPSLGRRATQREAVALFIRLAYGL